jgi:hypothetical protein
MNRRLSAFLSTSASTLCLALAACTTTVPPTTSEVLRSRVPTGYQATIANYFSFKQPGWRKSSEINIGKPEPGGCPLGGTVTSSRGWVVPVALATRTGTPGKDIIEISTKQYYVWFLEETIAGVTPRIEICP